MDTTTPPPTSVRTTPVADSTATLLKLKKQADKATKDLSVATEEYEANKSAYSLAQARIKRTRVQAARASQVYEKWRKRVAEYAASAYGSPLPDSTSVLLTSPDGDTAVQRATSLDVVTTGEELAITNASKEKRRAEALERQAELLAKKATAERSRLAGQITTLRKKSENSTRQLMRLLMRMSDGAASRDASRLILDATCKRGAQSPEVKNGGFSNGLLPEWALCDLPGYKKKEQLRADAAYAFADMNAAYVQKFGKKMCISDSYRNLSEQQAVYSQKPGLAAIPGKSNHGWGLALDLGCGVNQYGSPQFNWLKQNSQRFGWIHPAWAESNPFEPWHWEYAEGTGAEPAN
ncbi:MAG: hypothetical protein GEV10_27950 [Streptosporangiales bacterium]|nr:hypothetical protein [Streptosporangiales bacterium]